MTAPAGWQRVLPAVVGALLVVCAALVIIGVTIERGDEGRADTGAVDSTEHTEGEQAEGEQGGEHSEAEEAVLVAALESPAALVGLGVVSVALAVLVWRRPTRLVIGGVVVFTVAAGVLDVVEISHQASADRIGLVVLAGVIALLRVATVAGAVVLWRAGQPRIATSPG